MSVAKKLDNIQTHVVDILGSTKGRDQPIMKMDKAVELVKCLDRKILESDDYVFFDPFCKAGEILLATALVSNAYKNESKKIVSLEDIKKDIYESNRYFALAPDERHYKLSLRTFYGNENSHKKVFMENMRNGNYLSEEDGKLDEKRFNKELTAMLEYIKEKSGDKKIIVVGNPPYQENDGGGTGTSARSIYGILIESLVDYEKIDKFCLVIPSRWFSGGKGLDNFRKKMINSERIKTIKYFENSSNVFPSVDIRGGVCFINWQSSKVTRTILISSGNQKELQLKNYDIIIPHIQAYSIVDKVLKKQNIFLDSIVWARNPFGLQSNYFQKQNSENRTFPNMIECFSMGKKVYKIPKNIVSKNISEIEKFQVAFPKASGGGRGNRDKILLKPGHFFILDKNQISTETYSVAGTFSTLKEAQFYKNFLQTAFSRFLLGIRKPTQNTSQKSFAWVPLLDMGKKWTDEMLFEHFNISNDEQKYIKEKVAAWTA